MAESPSLPSLLWTVLAGLDRAHADLGAGSGSLPSLEQWSNLLRVLGDEGTDPRELPALLRLSKRAVRSGLSAVNRGKWAEEIGTGSGRGVRLTERGSSAAGRWDELRRSAERSWGQDVGVKAAKTLRHALEAVVTELPLEHPHYPAGYGAADARITGGNGRDWSPVKREAGDTVSGLALSALVSQALVALAMAYEEKVDVALSLSAMVLRQVPPDGRPGRELGHSGGLSALLRHGYLSADTGAKGSKGQIVRLTAKGRRISDAYDGRVREVEKDWQEELGSSVGDLRSALETVAVAQEPDTTR